MRDAMSYFGEIERIIGDPVPGDGKIDMSFSVDTPAEARDLQKRLALMQKELRLLKAQVRDDIREVKAQFVAQRANVQAGFMAGLLGGRGGAARDRKNKREQAKRNEASTIGPHEQVARIIDSLLLQMDQAKHTADGIVKSAPPEPKVRAASTSTKGDPAAQMRALKQMLDEGLITQQEHDEKRADILKRI